jgi:hypothetical protein
MVNDNFMEVNEFAIASAIYQQVGSSRVCYIEVRLRMALPYCKVLKGVRDHSVSLSWLEKLRHPSNCGV